MHLRLFLIAVCYFIFIAGLLRQVEVSAEDGKIPRIEITGDSIYLDGKKFFIKGIGYSPYRPEQRPGSPISLETVEADFKRIKEAGFNTLRVWDIMPEKQLELAEKYGLKVIQAAFLQPDADFNYNGYVIMAESKVRQMCKQSRNHPNVVMYLLMNEPHADAVADSGVENTLNLYKRLVKIVKQEDPDRPVSMANAHWTLWLDQSMWDVVSFNAYSYCTPAREIGYANFVNSLKSLHSKERPFIVTEFGLSVSPQGNGKGSYGGNTEKEQAEGVVNCFRELIEGGAAGGCVFEWNDEWWKAGNPSLHDIHPEEWFGIIGIEKRINPLGTPRKAYYSLKDELKLIVTKPKDWHKILDYADMEVYASKDISNVQYRIDEGKWLNLARTDDWCRGTIDGSNMKPGFHILTIKGLDKGKELTRSLKIIKCKDEKEALPPINIKLTTDKPSYKNGDRIKVNMQLTDREGAPLKKQYVKMGIFNTANSHNRYWEGYSDENGIFSKAMPAVGKFNEWYYVYWGGAEIEDYGYKKKVGEIGCVKAEIGEGFPVRWLVAKKAEEIKIDGMIEQAWLNADKIEIDIDTNFAEGYIDGPEDLKADVSILWDKSNIYLLASVKDDIPMMNKYKNRDVWNGDCIELFISIDPSKIPENGYSNSDFQILIGANGSMWIPGQTSGGVRNGAPLSSKAVAKKNGAGYILEAKINIANFRDKTSRLFEKGDILGFDLAIGDADKSGMREGKLVWNGTAEGYEDSAVWGRIRLE